MDQNFKTNDMALATYMKCTGAKALRVEWEDGTCFWTFRATPDAMEAVEAFEARTALVEPVRFSKVYGHTKREFYRSQKDRSV